MNRTGNRYVNRTGEKHITNEGYEIEIIDCKSKKQCTIQFEDGFIVENKWYKAIKKGTIKNLNHPSVYGVGFIGYGEYNPIDKTKTALYYTLWQGAIRRGYDKVFKDKNPCYSDTLVCKEWHNFQNFAQWYEENYNPETMQGWQLDKDILIKGNKIYSPETCCFVPQEINKLFTKRGSQRGECLIGVNKRKNKYTASINKGGIHFWLGTFNTEEEAFQAYKIAKETYIKEVADRWKGLISDQVYQTLINYKVEITD